MNFDVSFKCQVLKRSNMRGEHWDRLFEDIKMKGEGLI